MPLLTTHGSVGEFDSDENEDDWETYVERVALYFTANGISDATKKRAILLSVCDVPCNSRSRSARKADRHKLRRYCFPGAETFQPETGGDDTEVQVQFKVPSGR